MMSTCSKSNKRNVTTSTKDDAVPAKVASKRTVQRKLSRSRKTSSDAAAIEDEVSGDVEQCGVCEQRIIDGKEQALFCAGVRKQWVHRYCEGVSAAVFKKLSTITTPFRYYTCSQLSHESELASLKESVLFLQKEVEQLCDASRCIDMLEMHKTQQSHQVDCKRGKDNWNQSDSSVTGRTCK